MSWTKPSAAEVRRALAIYLDQAYAGKSPPAAVSARIEPIGAAADDEQLYACKAFERDAAVPPRRYAVRLGNPSYPHMKLVIEPTPDGEGSLFRVDTHDAHCLPPPTSKEYGLVSALIAANGKLAATIESAWREAGLPTFRGYLQEDLARRAADASAKAATGGSPSR